MVININDDRMIMEFLSGRYLGVPDGHVVYMNYPLSGFLAALYRIFPNADWYGYFLTAVMAVSICFVIRRIMKLTDSISKKRLYAAAAFGVCLFAVGREFLSMTYTTVAAISGAAALFSYGTSKGSAKETAVTAGFAALTWCIRDELFWMIVPMAGLMWLFRELPQKKTFWKKLILPAAVFGSVGICMLWNQAMYSSPEWKEYAHFNKMRTEIYDYGDGYYLPGYDEYREYYDRVGLTNEERRMLIYYQFLPAEDEISPETFEKMIAVRSDYGINENLPPAGQRIPMKTKEFLSHMAEGAYGMLFYVSAAGFLFLTVYLLRKKKHKEAAEAILCLLTGIGLFWVMEFRGRLPERVIYSLSLMLFTELCLNLLRNREAISGGECALGKIMISGIILCTVFGIYRCGMTVRENRVFIENQKELTALREYCRDRPENFYFVTGDVLTKYGEVLSLSGRDNGQLNYISLGDWISYSPLEKERIAQENIASVTEALLNRKDIYLIAERESAGLLFLEDYLTQRSGREVTAEISGEITAEYACYRFR